MDEFMDKMLLGGGIEDMKTPSKSLVVKTYHAEEYKNQDMFSTNQAIKDGKIAYFTLEKINEQQEEDVLSHKHVNSNDPN